MPKGEPVKIETGDKLYILNDEAESAKIGFIFVQKYESKAPSEVGKKRCKAQIISFHAIFHLKISLIYTLTIAIEEIEKDEEMEDESKPDKRIKRQDTPAIVQQMKCSI